MSGWHGHFGHAPWCRYADDGLVHCRTEQEAQAIMAALAGRLAECGLEMHPDKTQIVYCKDEVARESTRRRSSTSSDTPLGREW